MSRHSLLLTAGGGGGFTPPGPPGRIPGTYGTDDLLPGGAKVRGLNLVASSAQWHAGTAGDGWAVQWRFWDATWMAAQLDDAVAFGCNVVRLWGSIRGIWLGYYTRAEYLAMWDDLIEMCRVRDLKMYVVGNPGGSEISDIPYSTVEAELVAWAAHVTSYRTTMAIDLVQEDTDYGASTDGVNLIAAVRAVTTVPITYSVTGTTKSQLGQADNNTVVSAMNGIVDFFDFHWYYNPAAADIETYWWANGRTKKLLIGEYGETLAAGPTAQTARFEAVAATVNYLGGSGRRPSGAFAWVARDFGTDPVLSMGGLSEADGTRRTWIITPFETIPLT